MMNYTSPRVRIYKGVPDKQSKWALVQKYGNHTDFEYLVKLDRERGRTVVRVSCVACRKIVPLTKLGRLRSHKNSGVPCLG